MKQMPASEPSAVSVKDHIVSQEAMLLGFLAENTLLFTMVPKLIKLTKAMSADKTALSKLSMNRTTASYKIRFGLGKTIEDQLSEELQNTYSLLNTDEATNDASHKKILMILVSFFLREKGEVVVRHFASISLESVTSSILFDHITEIFQSKNLPWTRLMSVLLDSCGVMRGEKSGLEVRLRQGNAPHLLDIDDDSLHHVHNASKKITEQFDQFIEILFHDLFNNLKWSPDLQSHMKELAELVGVSFIMPGRYVPTRWLSVLNCDNDFLNKKDAYALFYFLFIQSNDNRSLYKTDIDILLNDKNDKVKSRVKQIQAILRKKKLTEDGQKRIIHRLFIQSK